MVSMKLKQSFSKKLWNDLERLSKLGIEKCPLHLSDGYFWKSCKENFQGSGVTKTSMEKTK